MPSVTTADYLGMQLQLNDRDGENGAYSAIAARATSGSSFAQGFGADGVTVRGDADVAEVARRVKAALSPEDTGVAG